MHIKTLDLNHQDVPETIAAYLVIGSGGPVLVETGPGATLPTLLNHLAQLDISPQQIKHVLVTHIHFDHAGAAGWWAQQGAQIYVHHVGARHLIDPSRLISSALRIYGDKMDTLWGELLPAPAEKVTSVYDDDVIDIAGLRFRAIDTPGHASHHHVFQLGDIAFTGDAAGICLPNQSLLDLPAPPPEFQLTVWQQTIDRLLAEAFTSIYPTHFGRVDNVQAHLLGMKPLLNEAADFVRTRMEQNIPRDEIVRQYEQWNRQRASAAGASPESIHQYETANPLYMSVDGIMRYWRKQAH